MNTGFEILYFLVNKHFNIQRIQDVVHTRVSVSTVFKKSMILRNSESEGSNPTPPLKCSCSPRICQKSCSFWKRGKCAEFCAMPRNVFGQEGLHTGHHRVEKMFSGRPHATTHRRKSFTHVFCHHLQQTHAFVSLSSLVSRF